MLEDRAATDLLHVVAIEKLPADLEAGHLPGPVVLDVQSRAILTD